MDQISPEDTKPCPFCGEVIQAKAKKCRYCRELLDGHTAASGGAVREASGSSRNHVYLGFGVAVLVIIIGVAWRLWGKLQEQSTPAGSVSAEITLTTADRADVDCAAATGIGEYRCGFSDVNMPWHGDEKNTLKPYYSTDRHLHLIPGLFLHPALQERFKTEPPDKKPRDMLKRFTAKCNLRILGIVGGVRVRWLQTGTWSSPEEVDVASVVDCKVDG